MAVTIEILESMEQVLEKAWASERFQSVFRRSSTCWEEV